MPEPSRSTRGAHVGLPRRAAGLGAAAHASFTRASAEARCIGKPSASASTARWGVSCRDGLVGHLDHGHPPQEGRWAEGRRVACGAPGWQDVVGAGDVVAEGGRAVGADEHRPRPRDPRRDGLGVARRDLEVLGGERLGQLDRQGHAGTLDQGDGPDGLGQPVQGAGHGVDHLGVVAGEDRRRVGAVLGLGEQVERHRDRGRRCASAMISTSLGPGDAVDADRADHLALGLLHPGAAGAHDHGHGRDRGRPVGEGRDRRRAAGGVHLVDAEQAGGGQHERRRPAVGPGRAHRHDPAARPRPAPARRP